MNPLDLRAIGMTVQVIKSAATVELGIDGLIGEYMGFTTPSQTLVEVVGESSHDLAYRVAIREKDEEYWLAPELVKF